MLTSQSVRKWSKSSHTQTSTHTKKWVIGKSYKANSTDKAKKSRLRETNFRFPQPGEYYGDLGKSISDDPYYTMSRLN